MAPINFFSKEQIVGVFRGFHEGGLEFHADLVLPYQSKFQSMPMHGQFLLVQLETPDEAVLGRIASLSSEGKLSFGSGEEFSIRAVQESRTVPEDIREQYLKYRVNIRVLGVLRGDGDGQLTFVPSHRRLPHVGSPVAFPESGDPSGDRWSHHRRGANWAFRHGRVYLRRRFKGVAGRAVDADEVAGGLDQVSGRKPRRATLVHLRARRLRQVESEQAALQHPVPG